MINANSTYTFTPTVASKTTSVSQMYPGGVALALGTVALVFAPPQRGQKFVAADRLKGKTSSGTDGRIVTAKQNNAANTNPRVIVSVS